VIKGPWPLSADKTEHVIPLEGPYLTPMFRGARVALRVSDEDHAKTRRGPGIHGVITDLDTGRRYAIKGLPCSLGEICYCDAEILEMLDSTGKYAKPKPLEDHPHEIRAVGGGGGQAAAIDAWIAAVLKRGGVKVHHAHDGALDLIDVPAKWAAIFDALSAGIHAVARGQELPKIAAPELKARKRQ
jgi:hypothetical protein